MQEKETGGLNFMIHHIRSTFLARQERLFGLDRPMVENDLNEIITMCREVFQKITGHSKVTALLDKAWHETDSLAAYSEKYTRRVANEGGEVEELPLPIRWLKTT